MSNRNISLPLCIAFERNRTTDHYFLKISRLWFSAIQRFSENFYVVPYYRIHSTKLKKYIDFKKSLFFRYISFPLLRTVYYWLLICNITYPFIRLLDIFMQLRTSNTIQFKSSHYWSLVNFNNVGENEIIYKKKLYKIKQLLRILRTKFELYSVWSS